MEEDHIRFIGELKNIVSDKYHGKIINLMISGSHLFGFNSPDSDTDYRGCFQISTNKLLTTRKPKDFIEYKILKDGMTMADTDLHDVYDKEAVLDELGKEVGLLLAGNCNHWEHLTANQIKTSPEHAEMKQIFNKQMNIAGIYHSYRGMADQNYNKFIIGGKHSVKKYLYVLRGLMAGTFAIENNSIQPNIQVLSELYDRPIVKELIDLKQRGTEKGLVNKNKDTYDQEVKYWFARIDKTAEQIRIIEPKEIEERRDILDVFVHKARLNYLDGYSK